MKKYIFTLITMGLIMGSTNIPVNAQFYGNINLGWGCGKGTMNVNDFSNSTYLGPGSEKDEQIYFSLGKGFNFGLTGGNMFNEHIGAELNLNYLLGAKAKAESTFYDGTGKYSYQANMLRIIPAAKIKAGFDKIDPYARFGAVISLGSVTYKKEETLATIVTVDIWKLKGGVSFGFMGALGAEMPINDNLSVFAEINTINQTYSPKKGELKEATYNGEDKLPDMTTREKEREFVDEIVTDFENGAAPDSEPQKVLKEKFPLGSAGINFGIEIRW